MARGSPCIGRIFMTQCVPSHCDTAGHLHTAGNGNVVRLEDGDRRSIRMTSQWEANERQRWESVKVKEGEKGGCSQHSARGTRSLPNTSTAVHETGVSQ
ncbi:Uncharacterized protein DAT39_006730 [Clarias magur]|uniref:Uncharacterized protein n=1 Tax=Clarias magur TaxID=1594786 RepID=A0A8J4UCE7_CLAMG|nr:Uncharacterized protein DAT39_006730 [Clarias magur]